MTLMNERYDLTYEKKCRPTSPKYFYGVQILYIFQSIGPLAQRTKNY